ncbi:kinesin-like protein KLP2 [Brevipalpus obovatus]|uniref:kinesin-like protein KLP2 n=1 Tax=Brevipalpus obovatus TaxID=246614 RepID=UPI003D9E8366
MAHTIKVFVRPRPLKDNETLNRDIVLQEEKKCVMMKEKSFTYDGVFADKSPQTDVYKSVVNSLIDQVLMGFNCTVFAYGQTGSGKTYTMEGEQLDSIDWQTNKAAGLIPRSFNQLFKNLTGKDHVIKVSFVELYNEEVYDLLFPSEEELPKLRIQESKRGSLVVNNLVELVVKSESEIYEILKQGSKRRQVAATLLNASSSRSHTIFTITVCTTESSIHGDELVKIGKLKLVDLAGSENISRSGATDKRLREASCINKSLLTFGRVIYCLENGVTHIPYRESKLTRLLQDSLGGNAKTSMIATISPALEDADDTASTLDYAFRARYIVNKPEINRKIKKKEFIRDYAERLDDLEKDYRACYLKQGIYMDGNKYDDIMRRLKNHESIVREKEIKLLECEDTIKEQARILREGEEKIKDQENHIKEGNKLLRDKDKQLKIKTELIQESDKELQQLRDILRIKEEEFQIKVSKLQSDLQRQKTEKDIRLSELDTQIKEKEQRLREVSERLEMYEVEVQKFIKKFSNGTTYGRAV